MTARPSLAALREWARRVWGTFRASPGENQLERELEFHLEMAEEALRRQGHSPQESARLARLRFDTVPRALDALHEQRGLPWLGRFSLDIKLGARRLRKSWPLTVIGGLAMTIAIAIAAGGFSFVRALSGGPVPLDEGDRVVALRAWSTAAGRAQNMAPEDFERWRDELGSVDDVGAFRTVSRALGLSGNTSTSAGEAAGVVSVAEMTASGFRLARVPPLHGRALVEADEDLGAEAVVVIGYDAWRSRFPGDSQIVGRRVQLDGVAHTVVGVMPQGFAFPINHQYWVPLRADSAARSWLEGPEIVAFGRLAPGATLESARAEIEALGLAPRPVQADGPAQQTELQPRISPYTRAFLSIEEGWSEVILLLFTMLLLPPCANLAILVYARTVVRQEEFAVRAALGASRGRIVAQLFIEMLLLSAAAALAALLLVQAVLARAQIGLSQSPGASPFWMDLGMSVGSAFYVAALAMLAGAIAGAVPAIQATGSLMQGGLRSLNGGGGGLRLGRLWSAMVVTQIALAMLLLPSAVNLGWGFLRPIFIGPGVAAQQYTTARVQFFGPAALFAEREAELVRRVRAEAGVEAVAASQSVPGAEPTRYVVELERTESAVAGNGERAVSGQLRVTPNRVGPGFLTAFDVPLLAGRAFGAEDFEPGRSSVLINRAFAEQITSGQGAPLGRRIRNRFETGAVPEEWREIVGVVADFPANDETPRLYLPMTPGQTQPVTLTVRVSPGTQAVAGRLREIARALDPALAVDEIRSLDAIYLYQRAQSGAAVSALAVVTLSVLLLSAAGMYALMSFTVNQRRREIGIRSALGAPPMRLLAGTFRRPLAQLAVGAVVGLLAAYFVRGLLPIEDLGGREVPGALVAAPLFMLLVGVLSVVGPAGRALRLVPTEALRDGG